MQASLDTIQSAEEVREVAHFVEIFFFHDWCNLRCIIWLYGLISCLELQEVRATERRKQEEYIKQVEVCSHKFITL